MWGLQLESNGQFRFVQTMDPQGKMCWSEDGDRRILRNFACRKCEENTGEAVEQEEKLGDEVEKVRAYTY